MYSEILEPPKGERRINMVCLISAIIILLAIPYIYDFGLMLPGALGEGLMLASYISIILLFSRVYFKLVCGYRYSIVTEKQFKVLSRNMGTVILQPGSVIIERMYGSKGNTAAIIRPEEIEEMILFTDKKYKEYKKKIPLLNRKLLTNRGKSDTRVLLYEQRNKRYFCLITPSENFMSKMKELNILEF